MKIINKNENHLKFMCFINRLDILLECFKYDFAEVICSSFPVSGFC